jgi:hypothetical protein
MSFDLLMNRKNKKPCDVAAGDYGDIFVVGKNTSKSKNCAKHCSRAALLCPHSNPIAFLS